MGMGDDASQYNQFISTFDEIGIPQEGLPNVWTIDKVAFRLLPSILSSVVIQVESLTAAKDVFQRKEIGFEQIGYSGMKQGQIILSSPALDGLDVRFCDQAVDSPISPYFCEGEEVLREGVLDDVNPALVRARAAVQQQQQRGGGGGGMGNAQYRNLESDGNCWSEFRATLKPSNLKGWFKQKK